MHGLTFNSNNMQVIFQAHLTQVFWMIVKIYKYEAPLNTLEYSEKEKERDRDRDRDKERERCLLFPRKIKTKAPQMNQ